jgi:hypothetical protein
MDASEPEIQFDEKGVCNHCKSYEERARKEVYLFEAGQKNLNDWQIKLKRMEQTRNMIVSLASAAV